MRTWEMIGSVVGVVLILVVVVWGWWEFRLKPCWRCGMTLVEYGWYCRKCEQKREEDRYLARQLWEQTLREKHQQKLSASIPETVPYSPKPPRRGRKNRRFLR